MVGAKGFEPSTPAPHAEGLFRIASIGRRYWIACL